MSQKTRVFLVRHGESEANLDKGLNATLADHRIALSPDGRRQATAAGRFLCDHIITEVLAAEFAAQGLKLIPDGHGGLVPATSGGLVVDSSSFRPVRLRLWQSPYDRTRQTADGLWQSLRVLASIPGVIIDRREDDLLREQEFGLFDGIPDEDLPKVLPMEHAQYSKYEAQQGRYFARMPMGESRADVSLRQRLFNGTLERDREKHGIETVILASHGVTIRCHVKERCHLPYEWIEDEKNPGNCSIRLVEDGEDKGYVHPGWRSGHGHEHQELREEGVVAIGAPDQVPSAGPRP